MYRNIRDIDDNDDDNDDDPGVFVCVSEIQVLRYRELLTSMLENVIGSARLIYGATIAINNNDMLPQLHPAVIVHQTSC